MYLRFSRRPGKVDLGGSSRWAFLGVFGATANKYEKQRVVNTYTAKIGEAKYIQKRQADGPSCFLFASPLTAIGFRRAHPLGVSRCTWRYRTKWTNQVFFDRCTAKIGFVLNEIKYIKRKVQNGRLEMIKKKFSHCICCKLRDLGGQENWSKIEV